MREGTERSKEQTQGRKEELSRKGKGAKSTQMSRLVIQVAKRRSIGIKNSQNLNNTRWAHEERTTL